MPVKPDEMAAIEDWSNILESYSNPFPRDRAWFPYSCEKRAKLRLRLVSP